VPAIRVVVPEEIPAVLTRDVATEERRPYLTDDELDTVVRTHHPGSETELQMFEVTVGPNASIAPHAHEADEIIYVVEGELLLGNRSLGTGSSVHIPGNTLYAFRSGPAGLRFLNFRGHHDDTYLPKDAFMERRRANQ
jgi:quercetin dioxygenase-like cupin family protein